MAEKESMEHDDAKQDAGQIQQYLTQFAAELVPVLEHLAKEITEIKAMTGAHEGNFNNIRGALKSHMVGELRGRHEGKLGGTLSQLEQAHKALGHNESADEFWSAMHDKMNEIGVTPDKEGEFVDHVHKHLSGMLDGLKGIGQASPATASGDQGSGEAPEGTAGLGEPKAEVEVKAEGEPKAVEKGVEKAAEETKKAVHEKKEEVPVGSPEFFKRGSKGPKSPPKAQK